MNCFVVENFLFKEFDSMESPETENAIPIPVHIIEDKGLLQYSDSPLDTVKEKWRLTKVLKIHEGSADTPFLEFLKEWPLLKDSTLGPLLVSINLIFTVLQHDATD